MVKRLARAACAAVVIGTTCMLALTSSTIAQASTTSCGMTASATASAYDGSLSGASGGSMAATGYSVGDCNGLGQTFAIYQAGLACANAGIPAGLTSGLGYAIVSWTAQWADDSGAAVTIGPVQQQYDCGDTFD
jgi:hypothetical protein